ncbi:MAG TPA: vWA domain-containing protein [Frankiaceae bacterium]|nr:vWA domain-containing protein [Frankiaceae bacterium]
MLAVAALCLAVPASASPPTCVTPGAWKTEGDGWTRVAAPSFAGAGSDALTAYTIDERRPERLYVSNGVAIASSRDSGCTWTGATVPDEELGALGPLGGDESTPVAQRRLLDIQLPYVSGSTVWALGVTNVVSNGTPLVQPRVLLSVDGARTFVLKSNGLPQFGQPIALRTALSPLEAYVLVEETVPVEKRTLYATTTGGESWTALATNLPDLSDFVVDAFRNVVWAWDSTTLYASIDKGRSFGRVSAPAAPVRVDVSPAFTTIAFANASRLDMVSLTQGILAPAPDMVTSITAGPEFGLVATSSTVDGVTVDPPLSKGRDAKRLDVTPEDAVLSDLTFAQSKVDDEFVLYGFSPRALYRRSIPNDFNIPPPPRPVINVKKRVPAPPMKPMLRPSGTVVTLKPGERRRVGYDLVLPPTPTPLDLYFMTDSTGSMQNAIAAVQEGVQDIVDDLTAAGINLHFGVADFRDYPQTPGGDDGIEGTYPYKRRRAVGPVDQDLGDALGGITTGGGNGDDSALEAIYQAVTGAGRDGITADIPPGQGAQFRDDALKVVLVASDDEMREPNPTEPWNAGPTKQAVIDALNDHDVEIVGIRVKSGPTPDSPRAQMEELARGAGSLAPEGGVDCDGDDEPDIDQGEPLVCDFTSSDDSIAPAFINMLQGLKDLADVNVGVRGPRDVVRPLGQSTFEDVNVKALNTFPVPVEFACTSARYGTDTPVTIAGELRGRTVVSGTATVRCLAPERRIAPVVPPLVPPQQPPRPLRAAAVPPPPPPQPNPNVNPNPNPNPQAQGQGGMASQEEQQHQLALAENDITEDEELAFSAVDNTKDVAPAATMLAGVLVACAAAGTQLHLARRVRTATNPSRTPRGARP